MGPLLPPSAQYGFSWGTIDASGLKEAVLWEDLRLQPKDPGSLSGPLYPHPPFLEACSLWLLESMKGFTESESQPRTHCIRQPSTFTQVPGLMELFHQKDDGGILWSSRLGGCNSSLGRPGPHDSALRMLKQRGSSAQAVGGPFRLSGCLCMIRGL